MSLTAIFVLLKWLGSTEKTKVSPKSSFCIGARYDEIPVAKFVESPNISVEDSSFSENEE